MGRISKKLIAAVRKHKRRGVINLDEIRDARNHAKTLQDTIRSKEQLAKLAPAHALYVYSQNQVSVLAELLAGLPGMSRFVDVIEPAQTEYMPAGPPWSPLTLSYFSGWAFFDVHVGAQRETLGTCILDLGPVLGLTRELLDLIHKLQASRMGVYMHEGFAGARIILRELVTGAVRHAISASGYQGEPGQIWLIRVLPPPLPGMTEDVAFTTPYVIVGPRETDWLRYFRRTITDDVPLNSPEGQRGYETLLKWGRDRRYWPEYIMNGYTGHRTSVIMLTGLPDRPASLPHARANG